MVQRTRDVAVMCWFPTKQDPIPVSIKFMDDNGEICHIKDIRVITTEHISQGKRFSCETFIGEIKHKFTLEFFAEKCRWFLHLNS